jgi:ribosomal protein L1
MAKKGKRLREAAEGLDRAQVYPLDEAVQLIKTRARAKFDETVEIALNLGVDPPASRSRSPSSPAAPRRTRRRPRARTSSAPRTWPRR